MAITAFKTFIAGEVLLASDLNSSLTTIINEVNVHGSELDTINGSTQGRSRNLIINGDFSVWQRGAGPFTTAAYTADRWFLNLSGATVTLDQASFALGQSDVPGNPRYYAEFDITTGNDNCHLQQRIEDVTTAAGNEVTLSFYAKGINPGGGSFSVDATQWFGTGGSPSTSVVTNVTTSGVLTSSWQRFEYTFTVPSVSGKTLGTNGDDSFWIQIGQQLDTSTDAWNIDISNVQLEFGNTATEFEYVTPADQLARCQRYFERFTTTASDQSIIAFGAASTTTSVVGHLHFTEKRAIPSISAGAGLDITTTGGSATAVTFGTSLDINTKSSRLSVTRVSGTHTINDPFFIRTSLAVDNYLDIDAEL